MDVEAVEQVTPELVEAFERLIPQLSRSSPPPGAERARRDRRLPGLHPAGGPRPGRRPSSGSLTLVVFPIPTGSRAWIEDVVVDEAARGSGVGAALNQAALDHARAVGAKTVDLTSRPSREAANRLYQRLGFEPRETNVYRLTLELYSVTTEPAIPPGGSGTYDRAMPGASRVPHGSGHPRRWCDRGRRCGGGDAESGSGDESGWHHAVPIGPLRAEPERTNRRGGSTPEVKEHLQTHRSLTSRRLRRWRGGAGASPASGIDITDPGVRHFPERRLRRSTECTNPCISPLHDPRRSSGIIHTESAADTLLTLGRFFTEWGWFQRGRAPAVR